MKNSYLVHEITRECQLQRNTIIKETCITIYQHMVEAVYRSRSWPAGT